VKYRRRKIMKADFKCRKCGLVECGLEVLPEEPDCVCGGMMMQVTGSASGEESLGMYRDRREYEMETDYDEENDYE
jgi:hypothetical protein